MPDEPQTNRNGVLDRGSLQEAIHRWPGGYKKMLILHDIEGYQHDEVAEILGCNTKSQLHRTRQRLQELLARPFATANRQRVFIPIDFRHRARESCWRHGKQSKTRSKWCFPLHF
jgi:hypothetical protein